MTIVYENAILRAATFRSLFMQRQFIRDSLATDEGDLEDEQAEFFRRREQQGDVSGNAASVVKWGGTLAPTVGSSRSGSSSTPIGRPIRSLADHIRVPPEEHVPLTGVERFRFDPEEYEMVQDESLTREQEQSKTPGPQEQVIKEIVERSAAVPPIPPSFHSAPRSSALSAKGFPKAMHRSQFKKRAQPTPTSVESLQQTETMPLDTNEISRENDARIQAMSPEEIIQAQQEIMQSLDEETLERFRRMGERKRKQAQQVPNAKNESVPPFFEPSFERVGSTAVSQTSTVIREPIDDTLPEEMHRKYFRDLPKDSEKIEWMGFGQSKQEDEQSNDLRFDFQGEIMSDTRSVSAPAHLGLHHHGQQPDKAGYTVKELLHLSNSSSSPQRALSMGIITRITKRLKVGDLPPAVSSEVREQLNAGGWIITVRTALDDLNANVITAGVFAMWTMLCDGESRYEDQPSFRRDYHTQHHYANVQELHDVDHAVHVASSDWVKALMGMNILTRIKILLGTESLTRLNVTHLLHVLCKLADSRESVAMIFKCEGLLDAVWNVSIRRPWPPAEGKHSEWPLPIGIALARRLAVASKEFARILIDGGYIDDIVRFIAIEPLQMASSTREPLDIVSNCMVQAVRIFASLTTYGLYCDRLADHVQWISGTLRYYSGIHGDIPFRVIEALLYLTQNLIHNASDEHRTEPPHAISRPVMRALVPVAVRILTTLDSMSYDFTEKVNLMGPALLVINTYLHYEKLEPSLNEGYRKHIEIEIRQHWQELQAHVLQDLNHLAAVNLSTELVAVPGSFLRANVEVQQQLVPLESKLKVITQLMEAARLTSLELSTFRANTVIELRSALMQWKGWRALDGSPLLLQLAAASEFLGATLTGVVSLNAAISILPRLLPGHEDLAIRLVDGILKSDELQSKYVTTKRLSASLQRFYHFAITAGDANVLKRSVGLRDGDGRKIDTMLFKVRGNQEDLGLPLQPDWIFRPLHDLLSTGKAPIWASLGEEADKISELEVVLCTLVFARKVQSQLSDVLYPLMQVIMLEKDQQEADTFDAGDEVFRDTKVTEIMMDMLSRTGQEVATEKRSLENLMEPGRLAAFYDEFAALYASISFGHPVFARLLLPPMQMAEYSPDCRFLLWSDHGEILPTIRVPIVTDGDKEVSADGVPFFGLQRYLPKGSSMWKWLDANGPVLTSEGLVPGDDHSKKEEAVIFTVIKELVVGKRVRKVIKGAEGCNFLYFWGIGLLSRLVFDEAEAESKRAKVGVRAAGSILMHGADEIIQDWISFGAQNVDARWKYLRTICGSSNEHKISSAQARFVKSL